MLSGHSAWHISTQQLLAIINYVKTNEQKNIPLTPLFDRLFTEYPTMCQELY